MFRSSRIVFVTSFLIGLMCAPAPAQEKPPKTTPTDLGVQIVDGDQNPTCDTENGLG